MCGEHANDNPIASTSKTTPEREEPIGEGSKEGSYSDVGTRLMKSGSLDHLKFSSGNPSIEKTTGILRFYKNKSALEAMSENCCTLCMLQVPAFVTCTELLRFISPVADKIVETKIICDATPNQYCVVIKFKTAADSFSFYQEYNGVQFNSLENAYCTLLFVERMESSTEDDGKCLTMDATDLPTCAVCLERMEDGILTILCNHSFHADCLGHWEDTSCPVCRFGQLPELSPDQTCSVCGRTSDLWMCLICGNIGCGRYVGAHAYQHFEETSHIFTKSLDQNLVWDYAGDNFVHRLIQDSVDGKMVELQESSEQKAVDEKDLIATEYTRWFSDQMEAQRLYFEGQLKEMEDTMSKAGNAAEAKARELEQRIIALTTENETLQARLSVVENEKTHLEKKTQKSQQIIRKLQSDLDQEKQLTTMLYADKKTLTEKNAELEKLRAADIKNLEDQVNDLMMHFEAQSKLTEKLTQGGVTQEELQDGTLGVQKGQPSKSNRRRNNK